MVALWDPSATKIHWQSEVKMSLCEQTGVAKLLRRESLPQVARKFPANPAWA